MAAAAPFSPGSGWFPSASLPGVRDEGGATARRARRRAARRIVILAAVAALVPVLGFPRAVEAVGLGLTTEPATDDIVRVLADDAGHRFDRGHVREVEVSVDGTVWLAVGRRVLALGTPGAIEPRAPGWRAFPRRISSREDGTLWAVEDGGGVVTLTETGWTSVDSPPPRTTDPPAIDGAAVDALRASGVERTPRVLAAGGEPGQQRWLVVDVSERPDERPADYRLMRFDGTDWTVLGPDEGMPRDDQQPWTMAGPQTPVALAVNRTGRAWFSLDRRGLWLADDDVERVRFPGLGTGALDLASTPDGAIWIVSSLGRLYRWNPEACSAR